MFGLTFLFLKKRMFIRCAKLSRIAMDAANRVRAVLELQYEGSTMHAQSRFLRASDETRAERSALPFSSPCWRNDAYYRDLFHAIIIT